ncbi:DUF779 domain-containing protein [Rossellomorea aquimaris]|nr:DUF779 domain-containing protein [Rossellomorea aquimaris]
MVEQVKATQEAIDFMSYLREKHNSIMLYQSSGCCDGAVPMCYPVSDFQIGESDILISKIEGTAFYMHKAQYKYWQHTKFIIDVAEGRGATFSLDSVEERHFILKPILV